MSGNIAVFLCNCGHALADRFSFDDLKAEVGKLDGVAAVSILPDVCMKPGEAAMAQAAAAGADRFVVAACSVRTHGPVICGLAGKAGVNPFLVELVDLAGLVIAAGGADRGAALARAVDQLKMAVARVKLLSPLTQLTLAPEKSLVVIGGGVAGVAAAYAAATAGLKTYVVEKTSTLCGRAAALRVELPEARVSTAEIKARAEFLLKAHNVEVLFKAAVGDILGGVGDYTVSVITPEGGKDLKAGAVLLATGASLKDGTGPYGLGASPKVVTLEMFEQQITSGLAGARSVAFIQCAGSRNPGRPYCSRTCCMVALKQATYVRRTWPNVDVHFMFRDIQTGGSALTRLIYHAPNWGVKFYRFDPAMPPLVAGDRIMVNDGLTGGTRTVPYDLIVLATPTVSAEGTTQLARDLGLSVDRFGFAAEPLMRARPTDHPERGIFVAGAAHWPCTMMEAAQQGVEAAGRAIAMLTAPVANHPAVAWVDKEKCIACRLCEVSCGFSAVKVLKTSDGLKARVDGMGCKGCGTCAAGCPVFAIANRHYTDEQIGAQIAAA